MSAQPALFAAPARRRLTWTHTATKAYLYFNIHDAPDIPTGRTRRRRIMRHPPAVARRPRTARLTFPRTPAQEGPAA